MFAERLPYAKCSDLTSVHKEQISTGVQNPCQPHWVSVSLHKASWVFNLRKSIKSLRSLRWDFGPHWWTWPWHEVWPHPERADRSVSERRMVKTTTPPQSVLSKPFWRWTFRSKVEMLLPLNSYKLGPPRVHVLQHVPPQAPHSAFLSLCLQKWCRHHSPLRLLPADLWSKGVFLP